MHVIFEAMVATVAARQKNDAPSSQHTRQALNPYACDDACAISNLKKWCISLVVSTFLTRLQPSHKLPIQCKFLMCFGKQVPTIPRHKFPTNTGNRYTWKPLATMRNGKSHKGRNAYYTSGVVLIEPHSCGPPLTSSLVHCRDRALQVRLSGCKGIQWNPPNANTYGTMPKVIKNLH